MGTLVDGLETGLEEVDRIDLPIVLMGFHLLVVVHHHHHPRHQAADLAQLQVSNSVLYCSDENLMTEWKEIYFI